MNIKDQVLLKMRLENTFKRELSTIFNFMVADFKITTYKNGTFDVYQYQQLWRDVLLKHYKRVQRNFRNLDSKKDFSPNNFEEQNITLALEVWATEMADKVSSNITRTSLDDVRRAMYQAQEESEERLDAMALALAAAVLLRRRFKGRRTVIATSETNSASEHTKLTEKSVKSETIVEGVVVAKVVQKVWQNVGDSRTRPSHMAAGGQVRNLNEPFQVGNSLMQYPGDRSLGAGIEEIAHCRCSIFFI